MTHSKRLSDFIKRNDRGVSFAPFKAAQVLLAIAAARFYILLRQASFPTEAGKISTNQLAHIHARKIAVYIL